MVTRRLKGARVVMARSGPRGVPGDMSPTEWQQWQNDLAAKVGKTGNESIAGTKTFASPPVVPTPSAAGHAAPKSYIDGLIDALTGLLNTLTTFVNTHVARTDNPHGVTKAQVSLGNVDNTSDLNKPVSTAQQAALDLKTNRFEHLAHVNSRNNPHRTTKAQVGLGNVDNTSDMDKPISTAARTVFDAHAAALKPDAVRYEGDVLWVGPAGPQWHNWEDIQNGIWSNERFNFGTWGTGPMPGGGE